MELPANANLRNTGVTTVVNNQNQQHMLMKEGRKNILRDMEEFKQHPRVQDSQAGQELVLGMVESDKSCFL